MIALRNRNGGLMVIGIGDKTLSPVAEGRPADLRAAYHPDALQPIPDAIRSLDSSVSSGMGGYPLREHEQQVFLSMDSFHPIAANHELLERKTRLTRA